ncbi:MAG: hypothetical protein GXO39_07830 [Thermotogae bacterium]|nr:hypothetical protein [Thermotogota bacterium]
MGWFSALIVKEVKLSFSWFLANISVLLILSLMGIYYAQRGKEVSILFLLLALGGIGIWSIFSGVATYFNERQGRLYEFVNTLPIHRSFILLAKVIWLAIQSAIYIGLLTAAAYLILNRFSGGNALADITLQQAFLGVVAFYLRVMVMVTAGLCAAALVKELPFKWFLAIVMLFIITWSLGWLDLSRYFLKPHGEDVVTFLKVHVFSGSLQLGFALALLIVSGFWIERRTY